MEHGKVFPGVSFPYRSGFQTEVKTLTERVPQKRDDREPGQVKAGAYVCRQDHS
jgi:hypothetical protein